MKAEMHNFLHPMADTMNRGRHTKRCARVERYRYRTWPRFNSTGTVSELPDTMFDPASVACYPDPDTPRDSASS